MSALKEPVLLLFHPGMRMLQEKDGIEGERFSVKKGGKARRPREGVFMIRYVIAIS